MYTLHIANKNYSSWSLRPWVLLKTLQIPFKESQHFLSGDTTYRNFKTFSPSGRVPVLYDNDTIIWDSLAIVEYLFEKHDSVWPMDRRARAWARSAAAEMHSSFEALRTQCQMNCSVEVKLNEIPENLKKDIDRIDELFESGLDQFGGPYLSGHEFTAVDAFFCPVAFRVRAYNLPLNTTSRNYLDKLLQLPAMEEWFDSAIKDPRYDVYEQATKQYGSIIKDMRI